MTCGQALSWRRIGPILLTSIGCRHCSFWCISSICWAYFSDAMVFTRIQKAVVDQSGNRPPNSDHDLFWEELWSFFLVQALSCLLSFSLKIHFSLHVTIWSRNGLLLLLHTIKEEQHFKTVIFFFLICGQLVSHPLIKLFHLSNLLQMPDDHRMVDVEFFGNSLCSCKRIGFNDPFNWSLSTSDGQPLCLSSRLLSSLKTFLNHNCTICSLAVLGPNVLMLGVVCFALRPFWTRIRKPLAFAFCLTLFP